MRWGDLITVAVSGDYAKPRPAVIIQSDFLTGTDRILDCLLTTTLRDAQIYRLALPANEAIELKLPSQVMVDEIMAVRGDRCGPAIGRANDTALLALSRLLAFAVRGQLIPNLFSINKRQYSRMRQHSVTHLYQGQVRIRAVLLVLQISDRCV